MRLFFELLWLDIKTEWKRWRDGGPGEEGNV